jgi:tetratricopeptide (TPR) repeat protein/uncharacterized protein YgiM (DUF1202 family)
VPIVRRLQYSLLLLFAVLTLFSTTSIFTLAQAETCDLTTAAAFNTRGDTAYYAGDYESAIADYTCALELDTHNAYAYNGRGNVYHALERYDEAIADYNLAIEYETDNAWYAYFNRGSAYLSLKDYEQAEADLNRAIELNPGQGTTYNNRGNIYYEQGDYTRAIEDYDKSIELPNDEKYIPYYNRGIAYYELGDYAQSLEDLTQSLTLNPEYEAAYLARAGTYMVTDVSRSHADFLRWMELIETERIEEAAVTSLEDEVISMTEGRVYEYAFDAGAGQKLSVAARTGLNLFLDPLIVVLDESGTPIASDDDSGLNLDAVIAGFELPETGTYTLLVSHAGGGSDGDVVVTLTLDGEASKVFSVYTLEVNQPARVYTTEGDRLNLRSGPGLNFEIVGKLERETTVTLLEGPRKADGLAWWRVRTADGVEGWSVERVDDEQTLQPPLIAGGAATVYPLSGDKLNVREGAGRSNPIVTQLEQGAVVTILEGPQEADGFRWWKIRTSDGIEGWAVDEAEGEQTLIGKAPEQE